MSGATVADFVTLKRQPPLAVRVAEEMLEAIGSGQFRPGEQLPSERELGLQFGVSRTVIREAVRSLHAKGVLDVSPGRGAHVSEVSSSRVTEALELYLRGAQSQEILLPAHIAEVRETLETRLVEIACERATDEDLAALAREHDLLAKATDPETAATHDAEFHRRLAVATHNALYLTLIESINAAMRTIRINSFKVEGRLAEALAEHEAVLNAVHARQAAASRAAMQYHLVDSQRFYGGNAGVGS